MKNKFLNLFMILCVGLFAAACSNDGNGDSDEYSGDGNILMKVSAVGVSEGPTEMTVAKPICIYVFDVSGKCVAHKIIADESKEADFSLTAGVYTVYSVAGADADRYDLPSRETATPQTVVSLKEGQKHADLMTAAETVELKDGYDAEVTLEMMRRVFKLVSVCVNNVPDDVIDVSAVLSPFYENVMINGEYAGEGAKESVSLSRVGKTAVWKNDCALFLLPSVGKPVLQFVFTSKTGKKSFVTAGESELTANYKIEINVDYVDVAAPTLKCNIKGVEWGETKQWNFTANASDFTDVEDGDVDIALGEAPAAGTVYKGCYVLKSETDGNKTVVTVITPKYMDKLSFTDGDNNSIKSAVGEAISKLAVEGIEGWRLPTLEEIKWVKENKSAISSMIGKLSAEYRISGLISGFYYYLNGDNIMVYSLNNETNMLPLMNYTKSSYLRPFATIVFYKGN